MDGSTAEKPCANRGPPHCPSSARLSPIARGRRRLERPADAIARELIEPLGDRVITRFVEEADARVRGGERGAVGGVEERSVEAGGRPLEDGRPVGVLDNRQQRAVHEFHNGGQSDRDVRRGRGAPQDLEDALLERLRSGGSEI
jgi:hypothetical protein